MLPTGPPVILVDNSNPRREGELPPDNSDPGPELEILKAAGEGSLVTGPPERSQNGERDMEVLPGDIQGKTSGRTGSTARGKQHT